MLDALATAYVTEDPERVADLAATVVLTVNPTELAHCLGLDEDEVAADLAGHASVLARRTPAIVLCGGPTKFVAHADDLWRVEAGNPGLGTAGSGDVQAGIVAVCWRVAPSPRRPRSGARTSTRSPATGSPSASGPSATWPASCPASCPGCSPSWAADARPLVQT